MRRNILLVTGVFFPEPVVSARILSDLALELSKNNNVSVLRPKPTRPMGFLLPSYDYKILPYKVIELDSYTCPRSSLFGRLRESYSMGKYCVQYIEENHENIDFIYNASWPLLGRYMIAKVAVKYNIPYITPVQDIYPESILSKLPKLKILQKIVISVLSPLDKFTLMNAKIIHTISDKMMNYLSFTRNISIDKFVVILNWQDEAEFLNFKLNRHLNKNSNLFTFMYMGNVGPLAGLEIVIDAFALVANPKLRLVIAGDGSAKTELQKRAGLYPNALIEFWEVPSGKVPDIQDCADVMVLPVKKGFSTSSVPSKLPAYMFSSKPILASVDLDSDIALSIINSDSGWVVKPDHVNEIAVSMEMIAQIDKQKLTMMGNNGFNYAIQNFSKQKNLQKLCFVCESVFNLKY